MTSGRPLDPLFDPRAIAVVGASASPGKAGNALINALHAFPRPVYAVNPRAEEVAGRAGHARVSEIPGGVDLALLAVPPEAVAGVLVDCAAAGVRAAVVHSGGWAEAGQDAMQAELAAFAAETGVRILGPNTSGFFNPPAGLCASFVTPAADLPAGGLAIVAQSGGVNHALAFLAAGEGLGIRLGVGLGNATEVGWVDVLEHLSELAGVEVVALAIEGLADGRALVEAVKRLSARVPVVALKAGRTDIEAFARSHTGALTGSWRTTRSALAQAGAVVVDDLTELVDAALALRLVRLPPNPRVGVGVVTGQAGPGLLLADTLGVARIAIPELPERVVESLSTLLPPITYQRNPVDTGRPAETFGAVLDTVAASPGIDLLGLYLLHEPDAVDPVALLGAGAHPTVLALTAPPAELASVRAGLAAAGVPVLPTPERAARAIAAIARDAEGRARAAAPSTVEVARFGAAPWDEARAKELVEASGLATPRRAVCATHEEARAALAAIGAPVVVKLLHPEIPHKTEAGGVHLGVSDLDSLASALAAIDRTAGARYLVEGDGPARTGAPSRGAARPCLRSDRRARHGRDGRRGL